MQPGLSRLSFFSLIFTEFVLVKGFGSILDLRVELECHLRLIDELVLHLKGVNQLRYFILLYYVGLGKIRRLEGRRHIELLNLIDTLVYFSSLVHEIFELEQHNRLVVFDAFPYKWQHVVLLSQTPLLLQQRQYLEELHLVDLVEDGL